jgi:hypothetical protein
MEVASKQLLQNPNSQSAASADQAGRHQEALPGRIIVGSGFVGKEQSKQRVVRIRWH